MEWLANMVPRRWAVSVSLAWCGAAAGCSDCVELVESERTVCVADADAASSDAACRGVCASTGFERADACSFAPPDEAATDPGCGGEPTAGSVTCAGAERPLCY